MLMKLLTLNRGKKSKGGDFFAIVKGQKMSESRVGTPRRLLAYMGTRGEKGDPPLTVLFLPPPPLLENFQKKLILLYLIITSCFCVFCGFFHFYLPPPSPGMVVR